MKLGINALNINSGGGLVYLKNLIKNFNINNSSFNQIIIWGNKKNLNQIEKKKFIKKIIIEKPKIPFFNFFWSFYMLERMSKKEKCSITFCPAATSVFFSKKLVVANLNLLPFNLYEILRCGINIATIRLLILRLINKISFKLSCGVIFLTHFTKKKIFPNTRGHVVSLGISNEFDQNPKYKKFKTKNLVFFYNSTFFPYKNHDNVLKAFNEHIKTYPSNRLIVLGNGHNSFKKKVINRIKKIPKKNIIYKNKVSKIELIKLYKNSDVKIFASSCEAFPNIILETIRSSLPLITSKIPQIQSVLKSGALYFDEKNYLDILSCMNKILDINIRKKNVKRAYHLSKKFSWAKMTSKTFKILEKYS